MKMTATQVRRAGRLEPMANHFGGRCQPRSIGERDDPAANTSPCLYENEETYTLVVDGIGIIVFAASIAGQ